MHINVLEIHAADGDYWLDVLAIGHYESESASLLHVSCCNGCWRFGLLWLRPLWIKIVDWWNDRAF